MVITDDTNTAVAPGLSLAAHLRAELTAFAAPGNAPGAALLGPLLANGNVQVTIKNKGATATSGTRVTVNTAKTNGIGNEFVESVIFELTNASNAVAFTALENGIKLGATAVRTYGRNKADLEAEASWNVAQILPGRLGSVPSAFGANTILACQNHLNLPAFRTFFRVQPHDATAAINTVMRLPSEEMYAYNGAVIVAATTGVLSRAFTVTDARKTPAKPIKVEKLKEATGRTEVAAISTQQPQKAARFYWTLIESLRNVPGVNVNWGPGGIADWEFTAGMQAVAPDAPDAWRPKIALWITNKNTNIY
jgi:hypothetical protein